jgi:uncharacterized membrane protein
MIFRPLHLFITAALAVLIAAVMLSACQDSSSKGLGIVPQGGEFRINASGFKPGEVRFFRYPVGKKTVIFLVAMTKDREFKTAFDACITCYPHKKGYKCETGRVVCVNCGTAFELDELGVGKGNCVPIQIKHTLEGKDILINRTTIEAGARWF